MSEQGPVHIAIVDDDDGVRDSTSVLLESCGYATEVFSSARQFLDRAAGLRCDCLLVDVQMPGMSGLELLAMLRARGIRTPVILMTANVESIGEQAAKNGAAAVLRKPFAEQALFDAIAIACARKLPSP